MTKHHWTIGTRGSPLALKQTEIVAGLLGRRFPTLRFSVETIRTTGDREWDKPLHLVGGKGLFVKEIEEALLAGRIDLAVHSAKDLPTELHDDLAVAAVLPREDPRDAFLSLRHSGILDLAKGGRVGTGSLRRKAQLLHFNPRLEVTPLRGNVDTRLRKLEREGLDGIILAFAGVKRMGLHDRVKEILSLDIMVPPSGQGAIAVETRRDGEAVVLARSLDDHRSSSEISIERRLQAMTGGGCQVPLGINARVEGNDVTLHVALGREDGTMLLRECRRFSLEQIETELNILTGLLRGAGSGK